MNTRTGVEDWLQSASEWRERPGRHALWGGTREAPEPRTLERVERLGIRAGLRRAITVPVIAAGSVFLVALLVSVVIAAQTIGAQASAASLEEAAGQVSAGEGAHRAGIDAEDTSVQSSPGGGAGEAGDDALTVHVVGEVTRPGIVELAEGARVIDAIENAGGATDAAVLSSVNLARPVADGEQILVPDAQQAEELAAGSGSAAAAQSSAAIGGSAAGGAAQGGGGAVNINLADADALQELPRIGPALAQRIIDWRTTHGAFSSPEQLLEVSGIGERTYEGLQDLVTVG